MLAYGRQRDVNTSKPITTSIATVICRLVGKKSYIALTLPLRMPALQKRDATMPGEADPQEIHEQTQ